MQCGAGWVLWAVASPGGPGSPPFPACGVGGWSVVGGGTAGGGAVGTPLQAPVMGSVADARVKPSTHKGAAN